MTTSKNETALCDECMESPSVMTIVTGIYTDTYTPLCQKCALGAVKNHETWNHWIVTHAIVVDTLTESEVK